MSRKMRLMLSDFDEIRIRELVFFDRLVELGTITAAARELDVPKPTGSRWLQSLEERAGGPLAVRGARKMALTPRGKAFHRQLQPVLVGLRALRAAATGEHPEGTLRVSVPVPFGRLVGGSVIAAFRARLPGVRLEVLLQNDRVDLLKDRIDVAIRGGPLPDSSMVARRLAAVPLWLYAGSTGADGPLIAAPGDERLLKQLMPERLPAVAVVDDRAAVRDALQAGAGVGILPAFLGEPLRAAGVLIRVGAEPLSTIPVHAVFLPEQRKDVRVRVLIEEVDQRLKALLGTRR